MLISLSAPSCYWQSSLLQYLLNFFHHPPSPLLHCQYLKTHWYCFERCTPYLLLLLVLPLLLPESRNPLSAAAQRIMRADDWWSLPSPLPNPFCFSFLWIPLSLAAKGGSACHKAIYYPFRSLNAVLFLDPSILHFPADSFSFFLSSLPAPGKKTDQPTGIKFTQCEVPWKVIRVRPLPVL